MFTLANQKIIEELKPYIHKQDIKNVNYLIREGNLDMNKGFIPKYIIDTDLKMITVPFSSQFSLNSDVTSLKYMRDDPITTNLLIPSQVKELYLNDNIPYINGLLSGSYTYVNLPRNCESLISNGLNPSVKVIRCYKRNSELLSNYSCQKIIDSI